MKTVLINGGSRGIGAELVRIFSAEGYKVAFTYNKSENEARELAKETGALSIKADSGEENEIIFAVSQALSYLGQIDCLINNAAISSFSLFSDITAELWNRTLAVNLSGPFVYSREVSRDMISRKSGKIINISSVWGLVGSSCEVHYSTTKAGLIGMTRALAKELGPSGITVNAIAPGVIETDMNSVLSDEDVLDLCERTPLGRVGLPRDVAKCALYLASEGADFITGEVINVSGGFVI
ncbi:MAG: SDR family oxidoreductase [Clostridia bacterium]|nr:SDR family oxidoreductase [Clostridia bacterium]